MKRNTDRILTSHAGSLPRPHALRSLNAQNAQGPEFDSALRSAVAGVVAEQRNAGIDLVNDGEFGKPMSEEVDYGAWGRYAYDRIAGYELTEIEFRAGGRPGRDHYEFADYYRHAKALVKNDKLKLGIPTAPLTYTGYDQVQRDIDNLKSALAGRSEGAFITALSAGMAATGLTEISFYKTREEEVIALAEAMREEYRAITDAGLTVQLDDPFLVNIYEFQHSIDGDLGDFRAWAASHVEVLNHSLEGIPQEQVRYHVCWGSWIGPHSSDLPIKDVIDLILKIKAGVYSFEAANVQHEHEWRVWQETKLPEGRMIMPGVVSHKTEILEHPELVADRIVKYAEVVGRENVIAGTDCGMGGRLHPQLAWAKLKALSQGAALATDRLWSASPARARSA